MVVRRLIRKSPNQESHHRVDELKRQFLSLEIDVCCDGVRMAKPSVTLGAFRSESIVAFECLEV